MKDEIMITIYGRHRENTENICITGFTSSERMHGGLKVISKKEHRLSSAP